MGWLDTALEWEGETLLGDTAGDWFDVDDLVDWGGGLLRTGLSTMQERDLAKQRLAQYEPLQRISGEYDVFAQQFYDPRNIARLEAQEIERMSGLMSPLIEQAGYGARARELQAGMGDSTAAQKRALAQQQDVAGMLSDVMYPRARQNVLATGQMMGDVFQNRLAMMQGQPQFMTDPKTGAFGLSPEYQNLMFQTGSVWQPLLSSYLRG